MRDRALAARRPTADHDPARGLTGRAQPHRDQARLWVGREFDQGPI